MRDHCGVVRFVGIVPSPTAAQIDRPTVDENATQSVACSRMDSLAAGSTRMSGNGSPFRPATSCRLNWYTCQNNSPQALPQEHEEKKRGGLRLEWLTICVV